MATRRQGACCVRSLWPHGYACGHSDVRGSSQIARSTSHRLLVRPLRKAAAIGRHRHVPSMWNTEPSTSDSTVDDAFRISTARAVSRMATSRSYRAGSSAAAALKPPPCQYRLYGMTRHDVDTQAVSAATRTNASWGPAACSCKASVHGSFRHDHVPASACTDVEDDVGGCSCSFV